MTDRANPSPSVLYAAGVACALAAFAFGHALADGGGPRPPAAEAAAPARQLAVAFQRAARRVRPSVLNITTERWVDLDRANPLIGFLGRFFEGRAEESPAQLQRSNGTGFVVGASGLALTNYHVVADAQRVSVTLPDQQEVRAEVIGSDPLSDLAVLRLEPHPEGRPYVPVEFGDSDALQVGDWTLAVGNPFGLDQTVTAGIVSAKGRSRVGVAAYEDFIQTDAAINPGNSGGPLLDLEGRVIGVTTAIASRSGGYQGIGFAIPSNMARKVMEDVVDHGRVVRGWLGLSVQNASPKLARRLGLGEQGGALVGGAVPGSPADEAGLQAGDLIVAVAGQPVTDASRLLHLVATADVGAPLELRIVREGRPHAVSVVPVERKAPAAEGEPPARGSAPAPEGIGITARQLEPRLARGLGFAPDAQGVVITRVEHGSLAAEQGIRPGLILQEVDRRPIHTLDDLEAAVRALDLSQGVLLRVWDGEFSRFVLID
ncbi:MAG: Do family serine endopeptidase [Planctomycetota bacterium]|nr:MAG: Do family serine endopeptidase [Planctomycetota bacterium]